jgi:hypothetical protein
MHQGGTGGLTFTIGGSTPLKIDLTDGTGWEMIGLQIKVGGDQNNFISIYALTLVSGATEIYDFTNDLTVPDGKDKSQAMLLTDDDPQYFSNFTLTGAMVFDWGNKAPKNGDVKIKIGVAGPTGVVSQTVVPIPAAVWLFGPALLGLGWLRRKQIV